ncbi:hypothetical protein [Halorarius litoreus]|uniref:hypothetical protein n=1 Tax=Halorarius litoreus TaxID=2962676 RepID=UPI0020CED2FD|nr:hypothetical protein [Halorarius litoreus]
MSEAPTAETTLGRVRSYAFYLVVLAILAMGVVFTGELLTLLVVGFTGDGAAALGIHRLHVMAIAATVGTFLAAVAVQLYKPRQRRAAMLAALGLIVIVSVITITTGPPEIVQEVIPFLALGILAAILHPSGRNLYRLGEEYSPLLLGLTVAAAIPLLAYAVSQFTLQGIGDQHAMFGHYGDMVSVSLGLILLGAIASARIAGWRIVAWLTGLFAAYFGVLSVVFPAQTSSVGTMWGAAVVVWAVVFVAVAEYSRVASSSSLFHRPWSAGRRGA